MKILFVTSEAAPFISSGGLGEVMGTLPKTISGIDEGIDCVVIMPLYSAIDGKYKEEMVKCCDIEFKLSWRNTGASVYKLKKENVSYYFIENSYYCDREQIYGEYDDGERFAFFSRAVIEFLIRNNTVPDIIHANDWQTALSIIYLKTKYCGVQLFRNVKTVFTIHNIEYQGKYNINILSDVFDLEEKDLPIVEYNGDINLMKGCIVAADRITTVSKTYVKELEYDYYSFGLSDIIKENKSKIRGILNGIDYNYYSPEIGEDIYSPYTRRAYKSGKAKNKRALQKELDLEVNEAVPMLAMITRLVSQKGIELFLSIAEELLSENIQMVVLGSGDREYEERLIGLNHKTNFRAIVKFDRALAKRIYAASDLFIMPSKYEPCGLSQMIAMSYGAIPIARKTGGLADSIIPYGLSGANGFLFDNYDSNDLKNTVKLALAIYNDKKAFAEISKNALKAKFDWDTSAKEYLEIYYSLTNSEGKNEG